MKTYKKYILSSSTLVNIDSLIKDAEDAIKDSSIESFEYPYKSIMNTDIEVKDNIVLVNTHYTSNLKSKSVMFYTNNMVAIERDLRVRLIEVNLNPYVEFSVTTLPYSDVDTCVTLTCRSKLYTEGYDYYLASLKEVKRNYRIENENN